MVGVLFHLLSYVGLECLIKKLSEREAGHYGCRTRGRQLLNYNGAGAFCRRADGLTERALTNVPATHSFKSRLPSTGADIKFPMLHRFRSFFYASDFERMVEREKGPNEVGEFCFLMLILSD